MSVRSQETSDFNIATLKVSPGYIFTGLGLWPPLLIRAETLQQNGHTAPEKPTSTAISPYQKLEFDITQYSYKQVFYRFSGDQEYIRNVKNEIRVLIQHWRSDDTRLSHPEAHLQVGEALLLAGGDPVCVITDLELDHPHIFVVAIDPKLLQIHLDTILSQLPIINGVI